MARFVKLAFVIKNNEHYGGIQFDLMSEIFTGENK